MTMEREGVACHFPLAKAETSSGKRTAAPAAAMLASMARVPPAGEVIVTRGWLRGGKGRIKATSTSILPLAPQRTIRPAISGSDWAVSAVFMMATKLSPSLAPWVRVNFQIEEEGA